MDRNLRNKISKREGMIYTKFKISYHRKLEEGRVVGQRRNIHVLLKLGGGVMEADSVCFITYRLQAFL